VAVLASAPVSHPTRGAGPTTSSRVLASGCVEALAGGASGRRGPMGKRGLGEMCWGQEDEGRGRGEGGEAGGILAAASREGSGKRPKRQASRTTSWAGIDT
jgi:hypothetical protein